jgi:hypothetical protein
VVYGNRSIILGGGGGTKSYSWVDGGRPLGVIWSTNSSGHASNWRGESAGKFKTQNGERSRTPTNSIFLSLKISFLS